MRSGLLLTTLRDYGKRAKARHYMRGAFFAGVLMFTVPLSGRAQTPSFITPSPAVVSPACGNVPTNISSVLSVADPDEGDVETWFEQEAPDFGTLSISLGQTGPVSATIVGGTAAAPAIYYTPNAALSAIGGTDNFTIGVDDGDGHIAYIVVEVTVVPGPTLVPGTMPEVCAGVGTAVIPFSSLANVGSGSVTYNFNGGTQVFTVPSFVTHVEFDVRGAQGGTDNYGLVRIPGLGGRIQGSLVVSPGDNLNVVVGGRGGNGTAVGAVGGFNGGGNATNNTIGSGGAGGGASDIRLGGLTLADRVVVAGGGGGSSYDAGAKAGGAGGGFTGGSSTANNGGSSAMGGTQFAGGNGAVYFPLPPGGNGALLTGGNGSTVGVSGGGGGGYYGGGGGVWNGGGGGSSFAHPALTNSVTTTPGVNSGDGVVTISYTVPGYYSITWDATASFAGFSDVANVPLTSASEISVDVPTTLSPVAATTYNGTLTISNGSCTSTSYPISVTVKPVPTVAMPADQIICNGASTVDVTFFNNPIAATTLANNWVNDNTSIGLAASGTGHIASFIPVNTTAEPVTANITVTPVADGCEGPSQTFRIVNNPVPSLMSTTTPPAICDSQLFTYVPTSATTGTSFTWSRAEVAGVSNLSSAGIGNINEYLDNVSVDPVPVTYAVTLTANGCSRTSDVTVLVNSKPTLTSLTNPAPVCDSTIFTYTPTTATAGAVLTWSRAAVTGIAAPSATGTGAISERLDNTTTAPITVTYVYNININGCTNTQNVSVVVNPTPRLTSLSPASATCDESVFTYNQVSSIVGTTFRWGRAAVAGISNAEGAGTGSIIETLDNTTPLPVTVVYTDTLTAFGCMSMYNFSVVVNPKAKLTSTLTPAAVCTGTLFNYIPTSSTPGVIFEWARDNVSGISNAEARAFNSISEILHNTTDSAVEVPYYYVLTANGCANTETVNLTVNPKPRLNNPSTSLSLCDNSVFNFVPTSGTAGATFAWSRAYVAGIAQLFNSGTNNPGEALDNTTNVPVNVLYTYTVTANGCSDSQSVTVTVQPTPRLSSSVNRSVCTGNPFSYNATSFTPGATFTWSRSTVAGVSTPGTSGSGNVSETLVSTSASPVAVVYSYTLNVAGCVNKQDVIVTVNPGPAAPAVAASTPASLCSGTMFANVAAASAPPAGVEYTWSASNATVWATGSTGQYALINFTTPGTAVVTLTATQGGTSCATSSTFTVNVGGGTATSIEIIYFDGQFIAKQADVDNYQWGYDDATTLASTVLVGETKQNYADAAPDFARRNYWVMTTRNGCTQKTYYRAPTGIDQVAAAAAVRVFPNPAESFVNVEVSETVTGNVQVAVYNLLGQKVNTVAVENGKAKVDVSGLAAGAYVIECMSDGVKIATARFIKN